MHIIEKQIFVYSKRKHFKDNLFKASGLVEKINQLQCEELEWIDTSNDEDEEV